MASTLPEEGNPMKRYSMKLVETRETYVTIEAETEAEARNEAAELDTETLAWTSLGIEIESIDEEDVEENPS
jgi:hypothetical protein